MHHLITSPISSLSYQSQYLLLNSLLAATLAINKKKSKNLETRVNSFIDDLDRDRCQLYNLGKMNLLGT